MPNQGPGTFTSGYNAQSGRFFAVLFGNVRVGGVQNLRYSEDFGTHWVGEVGSDHKEPEFGMRQVSGTIERLTLNTAKIRDIIAGVSDSSNSNVDLRNYQFTLVLSYQEKYINAQNTDAGVGASNATPIQETIYGVMFSNLGTSLNDVTSLARENVSFIGKAVNINNDYPA